MMKPKALSAVSNSNFIPPPEWSSKDFNFQDKDVWKNSIHWCYAQIPTEELTKRKFVLMPDSFDQISVKTIAAESDFVEDEILARITYAP